MKLLTVGDRSFVVGDEIAMLLMEYATVLGRMSSADHVRIVSASSGAGEAGETGETTVKVLLNSGTSMTVEDSDSSAAEPANARASEYIRGRLHTLGYLNGTTVYPDALALADETPGDDD